MTSDSPLWDGASVALWLARNGKLPREAALDAAVLRQANRAVERGETRIGAMLAEDAAAYRKELT